MLKTIPPVLTPDLLWTLAAMGHGDRLALVNANYPAYARHERVIMLPGVSLVDAAAAILQLMPVDDLGGTPVARMVPDGQPGSQPDSQPHLMADVHRDVQQVVDAAEGRAVPMQALARTPFFALAGTAFAAVLTTDNRPFGCFLITKGVVRAA